MTIPRVTLTPAEGYAERIGLLVRAWTGTPQQLVAVLGITSPHSRQILSRYRLGKRTIGDGNRLGALCAALQVPLTLAIDGPTEALIAALSPPSK